MMSTEKPQSTATPNMLRRKLFKGAYGGVGVLMAVQAKTALGGGLCQSPSATISGNVSQRPDTGIICSGGRSPGFWKQPQHFSVWSAAGAIPPTFGTPWEACDANFSELEITDIVTSGTILSTVFPGATANPVSMWVALAFPNDPMFGNNGQLLRHLSAAYINSLYFTGSSEQQYPLTTAQVIEMWNATKSGGLYCPSSLVNCGTSGWSAAKIIKYIDDMYDINSDLDDPLPCKKNNKK